MKNDNGAVYARVKDIFTLVSDDLFIPYKLTCSNSRSGSDLIESDIEGESIMSVLTASGDGIKLASSIKVGISTASSIHPAGTDVPLSELQDLCGELNNQLMGKIKNKILEHDCKLLLGLPSLIQGKNLARVSPSDSLLIELVYSSEVGQLIISLHTIIHPLFEMLDEPNEDLSGNVSDGLLDFF